MTEPAARAAAAAPGDERPAASTGRHVLRWTLWIAIAVFMLAGVGLWNAHRVATNTLATHLARARREQADLLSRARGRPALLEPADAGDASAVSDAFVAAVAAVPRADWVDKSTVSASPAEIDRILAAHPEPLDAIQRLCHVPCAAHLTRTNDGKQSPTIVQGWRWLSAAVKRASATSDPPATLRLAALLMTYGADYARRGEVLNRVLGDGAASMALPPLRDILASGSVDAEDAGRLARVMDGLDAARLSFAQTCDVERWVYRFSIAGADDFYPEGMSVGWRHLGSSRIARAEGLDLLDDDADRVRECIAAAESGTSTWAAAEAEVSRLKAAHPEDQDELVHLFFASWPSVIAQHASRERSARVARAAVALAAHVAETGRAPASLSGLVPAYVDRLPTDPADGKPLRYADEKPARVWSVGADGKDDGGGGDDVVWSVWAGAPPK